VGADPVGISGEDQLAALALDLLAGPIDDGRPGGIVDPAKLRSGPPGRAKGRGWVGAARWRGERAGGGAAGAQGLAGWPRVAHIGGATKRRKNKQITSAPFFYRKKTQKNLGFRMYCLALLTTRRGNLLVMACS
jgi:hypothetical protein